MISKTIGFRGTQHFQTHPYQCRNNYKILQVVQQNQTSYSKSKFKWLLVKPRLFSVTLETTEMGWSHWSLQKHPETSRNPMAWVRVDLFHSPADLSCK